mgnify:CR=1 FL=1
MTIDTEKLEKILALIEKTAESDAFSDDEDFNVQDHAGGNFDDAYALGVDDGYTLFARELKSILE